MGEGVDNVIDDVTGRSQVATEGVGNVPSQVDNINQPMQMAGSGGQLKPAQPERVINDLRSFQGRTFKFGNETFQLDKSGMKHILERHHPEYWNGTVKRTQSFLDKNMSIHDVADAVIEVMKQNRDILIKRGTNRKYQIRGTYNGVDYVLGLEKGLIGQFYPIK